MYYSQLEILVSYSGGFIALAAQAMGQGEPLGTMFASLFFGFASALGNKMEGMQGFSFPSWYPQFLMWQPSLV